MTVILILENNSGYLFVVYRDNPFALCTQFLAGSRSRSGGIGIFKLAAFGPASAGLAPGSSLSTDALPKNFGYLV